MALDCESAIQPLALITVELVERLNEAFVILHDGVALILIKLVKLGHILLEHVRQLLLDRC